MEIKVFGPLTVSHAGQPIPITRPKCQALLALLIAHYPHGMTPDSIADALWPSATEKSAANSIRVHATHLRSAFEAHPEVLPASDGRYALAIDRAAVDVFRFEDHAAAARRAAAGGEPHRAAILYESAIAEWTGPHYAEFRNLDAFRDEVIRLDVLCLDTLEGYGAALLDDNRAAQAVRILEPMMEAHLLRENLAAHLMLALYRTNRQNDALTLFGRVKAALRDGLGLLPSGTLQDLANAIVLQKPALDFAGSRSGTGRARSGPRERISFVGRGAELHDLLDAWQRAVAGSPQLAYVTGVTGIGKSALAHRLADEVGRQHGHLVLARCEPDPAENFEPFPALLREVLDHTPPADIDRTVRRELARLVPDLTGRLPEAAAAAEPGAGRQRLFTAVATALMTPSRPRLIVIEDLHWARPDALLLLRHVLRSARGQLMVLTTFRRDTRDRYTDLHDATASGRLANPDLRIDLDRFTRSEIVAFVDAVAPADRRPRWLERIDELVDVSDGNPLALREVLRELELHPEADIAAIAPDDMVALATRRLRPLDESTLALIRLASVLGREFSLPHLAAAASASPTDVLDGLERGMQIGVIVELDTDRFGFAHPLFRNIVYKNLPKSRRARDHLACADVLEQDVHEQAIEGRWSEVARHLLAARPTSDASRTAAAVERAGRDAEARYAHKDASNWYEMAIACASEAAWPAVAIGWLVLAYGHALENTGDLDAARTQYFQAADTARGFGDHPLLTAAALSATPAEAVLDSEYSRVLAAIVDEALDGLDATATERIPLLRSRAMAIAYFDPGKVNALAHDAAVLAAKSSDPEARSSMLEIQYVSKILQGNFAGRLRVSREIYEHTRQHRLTHRAGAASRHLLVELLVNGEMAEFDAELDVMTKTADETSIPADVYWSRAFRATRGLMRDTSFLSEELVLAAALLGKQLQMPTSAGVQMLQTFALRYQQGRTREITVGLETPDQADPQILAGTALLAISLSEAGRTDSARMLLDRAVGDHSITLPHDNFFTAAVGLFGGVAARCGSSGQRAILRHELESHADKFCVFGAGGAVFGTHHHWLARLAAADGDPETARAHLERAEHLCHTAGATFWSERARQEAAALEQQFDEQPEQPLEHD